MICLRLVCCATQVPCPRCEAGVTLDGPCYLCRRCGYVPECRAEMYAAATGLPAASG